MLNGWVCIRTTWWAFSGEPPIYHHPLLITSPWHTNSLCFFCVSECVLRKSISSKHSISCAGRRVNNPILHQISPASEDRQMPVFQVFHHQLQGTIRQDTGWVWCLVCWPPYLSKTRCTSGHCALCSMADKELHWQFGPWKYCTSAVGSVEELRPSAQSGLSGKITVQFTLSAPCLHPKQGAHWCCGRDGFSTVFIGLKGVRHVITGHV